jgi:hypothetical protein
MFRLFLIYIFWLIFILLLDFIFLWRFLCLLGFLFYFKLFKFLFTLKWMGCLRSLLLILLFFIFVCCSLIFFIFNLGFKFFVIIKIIIHPYPFFLVFFFGLSWLLNLKFFSFLDYLDHFLFR